MPRLMRTGISLLLATGATLATAAERLSVSYGITRRDTLLTSEIHLTLLDAASPVTRVLVVAGSDTDPAALVANTALVNRFEEASARWSAAFPEISLSFIARPYPDGLTVAADFPTTARAYDDPVNPEAVHLWRWVGMLAPDLVVEVRAGAATGWQLPVSDRVDASFAASLAPQPAANPRALASALANHAVCDVAPIPALSLQASSEEDLVPLLRQLQRHTLRSPARQELLHRRSRSPVEVAGELSRIYGQQMTQVAYIPALALIGRLRLGELTGDASHRREVERIVQPWHANEQASLPARSNGSQQAGHLIFGELAGLTGDPRYLALLRAPADLAFDEQGNLREVMPAHDEMSDAIFLGTPLLAQAARLSGDVRYREAALSHLRFMVRLNARPDGLHQHSPVDPERTAWGRGNGFVIMGLALTLSELPPDDPAFAEVLQLYRDHLKAMLPHQDALGMWHQVVDHPGSYREYTVTCMTTFAIARGLRRGWIDRATHEPVVRLAWRAIQQRTASDGGLVDVCTGTGKMPSLRAYLDRPALLGRDDRGGAMALMISTELAYAVREGALSLP